MKRATRRGGSEAGFSLIEIIVSLSLLSLMLVTMAAWTFQVARRSITSSAVVRRTAELTRQVGRVTVLPFDSLPSRAGCVTDAATTFPNTRCITVTDVSSTVRRVRVVITPTNTAYVPDTVLVERMKTTVKPNPFNM